MVLRWRFLDWRVLAGAAGMEFGERRRVEVVVAALFVAQPIEDLRATKNPCEGVVVRGRNRVKFVIMAPCAGERETHDRAAGDVDLFVDLVGLVDFDIAFVEVHRAEGEEPGGDHLAVGLCSGFRRQQVAGELFGEEAVVAHVGVESVDDVVAVAPGKWERPVARAAHRFRVAGEIEPVASPAFAKVG